jgi:cellulase/cellobiase CelA1
VLVREQLLCQVMPPPPPGVANAVPEIDPGSTNRERYAQHSEDPVCAGCHVLIDPIGFGFEHYDAVGRFRQTDQGQAIDATGMIVGGAADDASFDGAQELAAILAQHDDVTACYAEQWAQFALGGLVQDDGLTCMADEVAAATVAAEGRLDAVVGALVASPGFRVRRGDDGADPPPPPVDDTTGEPPPEPEGTSTGEEPPLPDPDLEVVVTPNTTWPTGHCDDVTVTNVSNAAVTWQVRLPIEGMLTTVWSANWIVEGDETVFTGVDFNMTLPPGLSAMFGYCVETG